MKPRRSQIGLAIVCLLFGMALMMQLRTQNRLRQATSGDSSTDLASIAGDLYDSNTTLRQEVDQLLGQQVAYDRSPGSDKQVQVQQEVQDLETFNGVVPVTGPGVELTIDAALRPVDVQDLLNEIRNAGAEAISIGGQRVVYNTAVAGGPGRVTVNGVTVSMPVVFEAIGAPDVLDRALDRKGGMLSYLRTSYPHAQVILAEHNSLLLPAFTSSLPLKAAD
ncbi:MAG TPA: DUF881 domain-containing protein [Chloroflexota bacterium]|nr:DUF881 domain-containing protein [Chloroflexota bacterium]